LRHTIATVTSGAACGQRLPRSHVGRRRAFAHGDERHNTEDTDNNPKRNVHGHPVTPKQQVQAEGSGLDQRFAGSIA
jgi:hypothetical protein